MNELAIDANAKAVYKSPYSLVLDEADLKQSEMQDSMSPAWPCWSPAAGATTGPFMMADQNEKIIRMCNALLGWRLGVCCLGGCFHVYPSGNPAAFDTGFILHRLYCLILCQAASYSG